MVPADVVRILIWVLLTYAMAVPLRTGLLSVAPVAFAGIGAYTFAVLTVRLHWQDLPGTVAAVAVGALLSLVFALPLRRIRGLYTGVATLAFVIIASGIFSSLDFFGASGGIYGIPSSDLRLVLLAIVILIVGIAFWFDHSSVGRRLDTVRYDPILAGALGTDARNVRYWALVASGVIASYAGAAYANSFYFISPDTFAFVLVLQLTAYAIVGGSVHWAGPLLGAVGLSYISIALRSDAYYGLIVFGALMVLVLVLYPAGIAGALRRAFRYSPALASLVDHVPGAPTMLPALGWRRSWLHAVSSAELPAARSHDTVPSFAVHGLRRDFGGVVALRSVDLDVSGPGIFGIIGPNGSGKSTLLGVLSGLLPPSEGRLSINGKDLTGRPPTAFVEAGIARTFQQPRVVPDLRVWENIAVGYQGLGVPHAAVHAIAEDLDLKSVLNAWPHDLPAATMRRLEVARALIAEPSILFLDEPAAGLSEEEIHGLVDVWRRCAERMLVVIVEHNQELVSLIAEEVVVLLDGVIVERGHPAEVRRSELVRSAYLGLDIGAESAGEAART